MPALVLNNLEDEVAEALSDAARRHGRSVQDEAKAILRDAVLKKPAEHSGGIGTRFMRHFADDGLDECIPEWRGHPVVPPDLGR